MSLSKEASLSKMVRPNSGAQQGKSVVVVLSTNVRESKGEVHFPTLMIHSALRKKGSRQFRKNVPITADMTEEDVKKVVIDHFPYLKGQRYT